MVNINILNGGNITITTGGGNNHQNEFMFKSTNDGLSGGYSEAANIGSDDTYTGVYLAEYEEDSG
jgi:hypothetical protein